MDRRSPKPPPARASVRQFPHHAPDIIRLGDLDHQNHVNNAVFATYFETGRVMLIRDMFGGLNWGGLGFVVARLEINYLRELHWPGGVTVGTALERVGRTSLTYAQAVFAGEACVAHGRTVMVLIDKATRGSAAVPAEVLGKLDPYRLR